MVNQIPHREYRDGFLFNELQDYPEGETPPEKTDKESLTLVCRWPPAENSKGFCFKVVNNYKGCFADGPRPKFPSEFRPKS